jgi:secreted trypsin-like serine protease
VAIVISFGVVSAASCFEGKHRRPEDVKLAKDVVAWDGKNNYMHDVGELIIHEDWKHDSDNYDADIALILLKSEVNLTQLQFNRTVCFPTSGQGEVTGNGTVDNFDISAQSHANQGEHDVTRNELKLAVVSQTQCFKADNKLREMSSKRTFCAGFVNQSKSVCKGDSGGGFYQLGRSTKCHTLAGIVSATPNDPNGGCNTYSVFTDVSKFVGWIQAKMEEIEWNYVKFSLKE